jgi:CO/xanthine dehydrogenase Mo-binding subunit
MIGTPPAVANAVAHALGARCRRLPMLPERLLALGREAEMEEA